MANVLAHFIHKDCIFTNCNVYDAIDFEVKVAIEEVGLVTSTVLETIRTAIRTHVTAVHNIEVSRVYMHTAHFVWKGEGSGTNIVNMDEAKAHSQVTLARDRGCVDHIHLEFTIDFVDQIEIETCEWGSE